jgi:hypothetical protein
VKVIIAGRDIGVIIRDAAGIRPAMIEALHPVFEPRSFGERRRGRVMGSVCPCRVRGRGCSTKARNDRRRARLVSTGGALPARSVGLDSDGASWCLGTRAPRSGQRARGLHSAVHRSVLKLSAVL